VARAVRPKKKAYHHGDLRRALLDATLTLAAERGATGVTLREAARTAGVSQTAPYRHFADKQAMLAAAAAEGFHLFLREATQCVAEAGPDPKAQGSRMVETYVRFALEHRAYFRLMFGHGSPPKNASPELQAVARDAFQLFFRALGSCLQSGDDEATVKEVQFRLWALGHGIAMLALEKQILFDVSPEVLARTTRDAIDDLLTISVTTAAKRAESRGRRRGGT
jgi:AcrR family transcriptional regulator